jgi:CheY-like chemotaxis protein
MLVESWTARPPAELFSEQLKAIDAWNKSRVLLARALASNAESREQHLEADRRLGALRREQDALIARATEQVTLGYQMLRVSTPRIVVAHRQAWFRDRLLTRFEEQAIEVLASVEDGAEAVAVSICDQPDLLIVEELLPSISGLEVLKRVHLFCPKTKVAVQMVTSGSVVPVLQAGATLVASRRIPPVTLADELLTCLYQCRSGQTLM